ncbi:GIY-YIG nuclease family protein [Leptodesmis sp.]|uniref:GIY-YIG nuclease family protein n=1 Tax=Leptodesmis sp. TaxID=3100501 RepID=UPI0040534B2A
MPSLSSLEFIPYLNDRGLLPDQFQGKVGVYAIFDAEQKLQYIGYSRDIYLSLKQHLVCQPLHCYWLKVATVDRPNRTVLEEIRDSWMAENGATPVGNAADAALWSQPIDVKQRMTTTEQTAYQTAVDELSQIKILKQVAHRVEAELIGILSDRRVQEELRFNPKMKEEGWLDLK